MAVIHAESVWNMNQELLARLQAIIAADSQRMHVLQLVQELGLPDCWLAAGFVRSAVWDHLHLRSPSPLPGDIDVIWHDRTRATSEHDAMLEVWKQYCTGAGQ